MALSQSPLNSLMMPGKTPDQSVTAGKSKELDWSGDSEAASFKETMNKTQSETSSPAANTHRPSENSGPSVQHSTASEHELAGMEDGANQVLEPLPEPAAQRTAASHYALSAQSALAGVLKQADRSETVEPSLDASELNEGTVSSDVQMLHSVLSQGLNREFSTGFRMPQGQIAKLGFEPHETGLGGKLNSPSVLQVSAETLVSDVAMPGMDNLSALSKGQSLVGEINIPASAAQTVQVSQIDLKPHSLESGLIQSTIETPNSTVFEQAIQASNTVVERGNVNGTFEIKGLANEAKPKTEVFLNASEVMDSKATVKPILETATGPTNKAADIKLNVNSVAIQPEKLLQVSPKAGERLSRQFGLDLARSDTPVAGATASPASNTQYVNGVRIMESAPVTVPAHVRFGTEQWSQNIAERTAMLVAQQVKSAEIQLDPPELGPLSVKIQVHNDQAVVNFVSANASVRDALDQSLIRLREMLQEQGMDLVDAGVSGQEREGANDEQQERELSESKPETPAEREESSAQEAVVLNSGIDYFA